MMENNIFGQMVMFMFWIFQKIAQYLVMDRWEHTIETDLF